MSSVDAAIDAVLERWRAEATLLGLTLPERSTGRGGAAVHVADGAAGRWFPGATVDVTAVCLDRHLDAGQPALLWEGEPGDRRAVSYPDLRADVRALATGLAGLGVGRGTRVALHLGLLPETVVAMLACAHLGAVHCVLPVPLPADALAARIADLGPHVVFTQDGGWRHGAVLPLKARVDEALEALEAGAGIEHTIVVRRTGVDVEWFAGDRWYHDLLAEGRRDEETAAPAAVPAGDPLLVTYHADRGGHPVGLAYGVAGTLVAAAAVHRYGLAVSAPGVFWCAVDVGWLAGQTHGVYGPLVEGATVLIYEGALDTPTPARAWELVARHGVAAVMTTPSVVRFLRDARADAPAPAQIASLRRLTTVGEPSSSAERSWLAGTLGAGVALADGWGQEELGGVVAVREVGGPTHVRGPGIPDTVMEIVDDQGTPLPAGAVGELALAAPWPGTFVGVVGVASPVGHWRLPGRYLAGDAASREEDGSITFLGRLDPVVSVSGQLVSADEVRDRLVEHPDVAQAVVVDQPDPRTGQAVLACVVLATGAPSPSAVAAELRRHVDETLGGLARPRTVVVVDALPADVPRRLLRRALRMATAAHAGGTVVLSSRQLEAALVTAGAETGSDR